MFFAIPRSPRWLVKKERIEEAREVLETTGDANMNRTSRRSSPPLALSKITLTESFSPPISLPDFSRCFYRIFNQFSGINAILDYLNDIFADAASARFPATCRRFRRRHEPLFTMIAMSVIDRWAARCCC